AQLEIGFEQDDGCRAAGYPGVHPLREARIDLACLLVRIVEKKNDVEVGRIAELLAAQLAVGDDGKARRIGAVLARQVRPPALDVRLENEVGERGEMIRQPLDREVPGEILR